MRLFAKITLGATPLGADGFHDHGSWRGPCSRERHAYLATGAVDLHWSAALARAIASPAANEEDSWFDALARAVASTRRTDENGRGRVLCLCCRVDLTAGEEGG